MASADAAKPASPPAADPPADDPMDADPAPPAGEEQEATPQKQKQPEKKRGGRRKKGEAAAAAAPEKKTPPSKKSAGPAVERPSRERKTVERYAELAPRATPAKKAPAILQGSGTKLKDIPNVSFKLSKRKGDENLQSLHTVLYGRKSNNHFLKRNISQFSGFVWTDNQEKQRNKIKEKLEKFNKEKLLDFCEILDISVKQTTKKEEVSAKLLEFLESPCVTRDVVLTDKKKGKKRGRKSKVSREATLEGASAGKKRKRVQKQATEDGKENDEDDADPAGSEDASTGEEADGDSEANDHAVSDDEPDEPPAKKKSTNVKQDKKETGSDAKEKDTPGKKGSMKPAKGASKPSQNSKDGPEVEIKKVGKRAKSSKESDLPPDSNKSNKKVSKSKKDDGKETPNNKAAARSSNKNKGKGKGGAAAGTAPTTEQLHAVVSTILKEVDFNTATLADILRQLGTHFEMDLMDRKAEVKRIIEEVINSMSDDEGEEDSEDEAEDNGKVKSKSDPDGGEEK